MTPDDARAREREALGQIRAHVCCIEDYAAFEDDTLTRNGRAEMNRLLDAYAASVRAATLAAVRERVEGMRAAPLTTDARAPRAAGRIRRWLAGASRRYGRRLGRARGGGVAT